MKHVSFVVTVLLSVAAPTAASQAPTTCSLIAREDMVMLIGPDATATAVGEQQCNIAGAVGGYEVEIKRGEAAREMEDWKTLAMPRPVTTLQGIGDEAYAGRTGHSVIARKGSVAIYVSSHVSSEAPMPYKEGVVELTRRIVAKLK